MMMAQKKPPKPEIPPVFLLNHSSVQNGELVDLIGGVRAKVKGTIKDDGNFIVNDSASWMFRLFEIPQATVRVKFQATNIQSGNIIGWGSGEPAYGTSMHAYFQSSVLSMSSASSACQVSGQTVGFENFRSKPLPISNPVGLNELVASWDRATRELRIFVNGELFQNGVIISLGYAWNVQTIGNSEGVNRFVGKYQMIAVYDKFFDEYPF